MLGYDVDLSGLGKLIAWCDPRRSLAAKYEECSARARAAAAISTIATASWSVRR